MTVMITEVSKRYGSTVALDHVSAELGTGITGLLGPNGAGKTTLLRCLATVLVPDAGRITVHGRDVGIPAERTAVRRHLGYLPQTPGFYSRFTCFAFLDYVAILKEHVDTTARHAEVRRVLDLVGLADRAASRIRSLSGGMRQRLALAQALLGAPRLLVLDEPTVGLDPEQRFRFRELVSGLGEDAIVLLSTHQTEDVAAICDRILVIDGGQIRFAGTPAELASLAAGRVWLTDERPPNGAMVWRTAEGRYRGVGDPPAGAQDIAPTVEDGYLTLVGRSGLALQDAA
jgi:ABC-2 type transport system ATP-binding protein